jgi:transposase
MKVDDIDIEKTIVKARDALAEDKSISPSTQALMEMLILIISLLCKHLKINSANSSKPPSQDPNRKKTPKKPGTRKPGGQKGRIGKTLQRTDDPDEIVELSVDRKTIPQGDYERVGFQSRQVFDFEVQVYVTEYQAEILQNEKGESFVASFPEGVAKAAQYGPGIKANAVYMNCYQMSSLSRIEDHFKDQLGLPVSKGSVYNFSKNAYDRLEDFESWVKKMLLDSKVNHADETGVNVNGERLWLHVLCNDKYSFFHVDPKRGKDATDTMGVLPDYIGKLCHDHWKPYFRYEGCEHILCNAHHVRELTFAAEVENQKWAAKLMKLLLDANDESHSHGDALPPDRVEAIETEYREILAKGEEESPLPVKPKGQRGRVKKTKSRNLLERLRNFEDETLRFIREANVPFTNNQGENDLRMTKVQQKVSGCFRSMEGAQIFARVRSYINTCQKHGMRPTEALTYIFSGQLPSFMKG